ncbi:MAG: type I restriction endonuclease subunit R, partial [Mycobacterium sp.]|nr:type I restriction endonuclease subunit R [Mycobacterium sp.]
FAQLLTTKEMREFADAYLLAEQQAAGSQAKWQKLHAELYRLLAPAVQRFTELLDSEEEDDVEKAEDFRADLNDYVRKYGFLAQIVPYQDSDLELLHLYGRHLLNRLPRRSDGGVDIGDVDLSHMRLVKTGEHDIGLKPEGASELPGFGDGSGAAQEPEKSPLSELIDEFNKRHGTSFTEADAAKPFNEAAAEPNVQMAAVANNSEEEFGRVFDPVFEEKMMDHYETITNLGKRYFSKSDPAFKETLNRQARSAAWRMIRRQQGVA